MPPLQIEYVDPSTLQTAAWNPRRIAPRALRRLATLLDQHGFAQPIVARREDRLVLGGHQRLAANALRARPDAQVPVVFLDGVSDARARALNVALNNEQAQGRFCADKLADVLRGLEGPACELADMTGFAAAQLEALRRLDEQIPPLPPPRDLTAAEPPPGLVTCILEMPHERYQTLRRLLDDLIRIDGVRCHVRFD